MSKILFHICSGVYPKVVGGMEVFNYFFIRELSKLRDVVVLSESAYDYSGPQYREYNPIRPTKIFDGIQLCSALLKDKQIRTIVFSFSEAHWLLWYVNMLVVRVTGREYIAVIHHGMPPKTKGKTIIHSFFRHAKHVVAVSYGIKNSYDKFYGTDCKVIPPLVPFYYSRFSSSECRTKYGIPENAKLICQVGTLKNMKNPDTVLRAVASFNKKQLEEFNPHIVYAGKCLFENFNTMIKDLGLEDRVHMVGQIPKEDVCQIMEMSDIYVISSDYEGTSVSLLEAMFNKKKIIISRAPGLVDMIREGKDGLAFELRNHLELQKCILNIFSDEESAQKRAESAYEQYCINYSFNDVLNSYLDIL